MRVKSVSELCGNEILAEPVLTDEKMILISRGSRLKKEYVPLIRSLGIDTLMVLKSSPLAKIVGGIYNRKRVSPLGEAVREAD